MISDTICTIDVQPKIIHKRSPQKKTKKEENYLSKLLKIENHWVTITYGQQQDVFCKFIPQVLKF
jgi:hypothetical protein